MSSKHLGSLRGGQYLSADGQWDDAFLNIDGELLTERRLASGSWLDSSGCVVLPGIVDFHGDAFERQIMPRPGVRFPMDVAMLDTDRQLAANGITTALHGVTYSWEGGLRGREMALEVFSALNSLRSRLNVDHRVHLRFEGHNLDGEADAMAWLAAGTISLLAFNDHLPGMHRKINRLGKMQEYADRACTDVDSFIALLERCAARASEVPASVERLAAAAREYGIPMASHDDHSIETREYFHKLGVETSEFPLHRNVAEHATANGSQVVCGGPNVLRGGSHIGAPSAAELIADGLCSILASDYYYPAPLTAAFKLARDGVLPLASAWQLVSKNPATALKMNDRGILNAGLRADMIVVDTQDAESPRLVATICGGRLVYLSDGTRLHG